MKQQWNKKNDKEIQINWKQDKDNEDNDYENANEGKQWWKSEISKTMTINNIKQWQNQWRWSEKLSKSVYNKRITIRMRNNHKDNENKVKQW